MGMESQCQAKPPEIPGGQKSWGRASCPFPESPAPALPSPRPPPGVTLSPLGSQLGTPVAAVGINMINKAPNLPGADSARSLGKRGHFIRAWGGSEPGVIQPEPWVPKLRT